MESWLEESRCEGESTAGPCTVFCVVWAESVKRLDDRRGNFDGGGCLF